MQMMNRMNATLVMASALWIAGCSGGGDGGGAGGPGPDADFMEISLDGRVVPTEADPMTFATYSDAYISIGMQAPAPGGGFLDDDMVINLTTNGIVKGTYAFAEDSDLRDLRAAGTLAGNAAVFDFDGTEYRSTLEGSVVLDGVSTGKDEEGALDLRWVTGSFSGTFESDAGVQRRASVRFAYTSL